MVRANTLESADILTVDYEDWFHIIDPRWSAPDLWESLPSFIEKDVESLLDLLDRHEAKATFFMVGWLADRTRALVREVTRRGHTLASHGYLHVPPEDMSEAEFREDLSRSVEVLERLGGQPIRGYRAPGFRVRDCPFPYRRILREYGLTYDASRFPGVCPGRGIPDAHRWPQRSRADGQTGAFWDVPISTVKFLGLAMAFSGGGFLRMLPNWFVQRCANRIHDRGQPVVCYLHPRDLNPGSPRIRTTPWNRLRYYGGRRGMKRKVESLLRRRKFMSVEEYLETVGN